MRPGYSWGRHRGGPTLPSGLPGGLARLATRWTSPARRRRGPLRGCAPGNRFARVPSPPQSRPPESFAVDNRRNLGTADPHELPEFSFRPGGDRRRCENVDRHRLVGHLDSSLVVARAPNLTRSATAKLFDGLEAGRGPCLDWLKTLWPLGSRTALQWAEVRVLGVLRFASWAEFHPVPRGEATPTARNTRKRERSWAILGQSTPQDQHSSRRDARNVSAADATRLRLPTWPRPWARPARARPVQRKARPPRESNDGFPCSCVSRPAFACRRTRRFQVWREFDAMVGFN